ncbi:uncharacterized protein LOC119096462 [Pollicipes pollicipes]|uniref:uncharacterized protein LOC119096457 n=1 Tax=Pollicipes pollicipes TaxID=41117 RepID=UPI001884A713|nr:uncharacterized protein LOC119096457 [Pollicipes pollicipes]XP_037075267.1 uncharacterized protein LOC119096462 [Pollicipes pollicipes]
MFSKIILICIVAGILSHVTTAGPADVKPTKCKTDGDCKDIDKPYCGDKKCRVVTTKCRSGELGVAGCNKCFCVTNDWGCEKKNCEPKFNHTGAVPCEDEPDFPPCKKFWQ